MKRLFLLTLPVVMMLIYFGCQEVPNDVDTGGSLYLLVPPVGSVCASVVVETVDAFNKDGTDIYVTGDTTIFKVDEITGSVETLVVGQRYIYYNPVVDANNIYWLSNGTHYYPPMGTIQKISK